MKSEKVSVNPHQLSPTAHFPLKKRRGRITKLIESKSPIEVDADFPSTDIDFPNKSDSQLNLLKQKNNMVFPRKRGRPFKNDPSVKRSKLTHPNKGRKTISKNKRRGRPKKSNLLGVRNFSTIDEFINYEEIVSEVESDVSKTNIKTTESTVKELDGSLNKENEIMEINYQREESSTIDISDVSNEATKNTKKLDVPKKRRGRPKKSYGCSNLAENSSSHDTNLRNSRKSSGKCINPCFKDLSSESSSSNNVDKNNIDDIDRIQCTKITVKDKKLKKRGRPLRSQTQRDSDNLAKIFLGNLRFHDNTLEISFKKKPQNVVLDFLGASD
ncbi:uncharacterized protein LOC106657252 [Trichogramma pretiosum]|uniref:uncharacterized protein LOC106657252 n=1 Tax=Trichogramma pretiosum TaxID=7493 RepID=UPI0006C98B58|nr:uncharacterized protein LOC106657252 [Trichogramma pretiosum]